MLTLLLLINVLSEDSTNQVTVVTYLEIDDIRSIVNGYTQKHLKQ